MSVMHDLFCQLVPSTPCFEKPVTGDAEVPDLCCRSYTEFHAEVLVPSAPISRRNCKEQTVHGFSAHGNSVNDNRINCSRHTPDMKLFQGYTEQVVPFTPQHGSPTQQSKSVSNICHMTRKPGSTHRRRELVKIRRTATPLFSTNIQMSPDYKERQLSLFTGEDIFA